MRWNKNGYTVTVRINLFAVGDGGGDLCTADPGSSHADIACFVVDTLADVRVEFYSNNAAKDRFFPLPSTSPQRHARTSTLP